MIPISPKFKPMQQENQTAQVEKKLREVSEMYEKHFMNEMVKSMRSTVTESGFIKVNQGEKIFREQLDQEYVDAWGKKGGIGLSNLIYDQLVEKYGPQLGLQQKNITKPHGPLPLDEKSNLKVREIHQENKSTYHMRPEENSSVLPVKSPWSGTLLKKIELGADEYFLKIQHDNGLQSDLKWNGLLGSHQEGDSMAEGQVLGYLSPDLQTMSWGLSPSEIISK